VAWAVVWEDLKALNRWDERWAIEPATSPLTRLERWESPVGDAGLCHVAMHKSSEEKSGLKEILQE
jgi:hypothetical protein